MGTITCNNCCHEKIIYPQFSYKVHPQGFSNGSLLNSGQDDQEEQTFCEPDPKFAKPVKQIIQLNAKVKQTYKKQKFNHINAKVSGVQLQPHYIFQKGAYYQGQWKNGFMHGTGRLYYDKGCFFEGVFQRNVANCQNGLYIESDGSFYKGQISNSVANGKGIYSSSQIYYEGYFKNNKPNGQGQQKFLTGQCYIGTFSNGKKHGYGKMQWPDKSIYQGNFKNGIIQGQGTLKNQDYFYQGLFKDSKKNGKGIIKYHTGDQYNGNFQDDEINGKGVYTWSTGQIYQGQFKNGKQNGKGKIFLKNGQVKQGIWEMGNLLLNDLNQKDGCHEKNQ